MERERFLLRELVRRDFEERYRGSALGFLWSFLDPAWQLLLYTFVFSMVLRIGLPGEATDSFPVFLFAGLIGWTPVRQAVERGATSITGSAALIKGHRLPATLFVLAVVVSEVLHGLVAVGLFVVVLGATGELAPGGLPLLLLAVPLQVILALGLALLAAAAQVYARDVRRALGLLLVSWFYVTPVVYPLALVPERLRGAIAINPMTGVVELCRAAFLGGDLPTAPMVSMVVGAAVALAAGLLVFRWLEPGFVDEI